MLNYFVKIVFLCCIPLCWCWVETRPKVFPAGFMFGAATSAFQVEGGFIDGRGKSIQDDIIAADNTTGEIACDSYHLYKRDVEMLRELGVDHYRFSVAWSRVMPDGFPNNINEKGLQYYDNLIDELLKYNIEPFVTMYHLDLPSRLQELGGWTNPFVVDWFEDYARVLFQRYGSKVKYWITVNQIDSICIQGYGTGFMAPYVKLSGVADYICSKNVLLAHARAYKLYDREFRNKYKGTIGISLSLNWYDPIDDSTENINAAEAQREFQFGLYTDPIFSETGDFPQLVKDVVAKKSREQGFSRSRLPELSLQDIADIKGSADFLGVNHYTTYLISGTKPTNNQVPSFDDDMGGKQSFRKEWKRSNSVWQASAPYGLYKLCLYLNTKYNYPKIIITENGWSTKDVRYDNTKIEYLREYLYALLLAIEDGTRVLGYTVWALMDNLEWGSGFTERFGLYRVDTSSRNRTRTPKKSALYYQRLISTWSVIDNFNVENLVMKFSDRILNIIRREKTDL